MKALILDGSHSGDFRAEQIKDSLTERLQVRGWQAENILNLLLY
jgi:hypothetical protein